MKILILILLSDFEDDDDELRSKGERRKSEKGQKEKNNDEIKLPSKLRLKKFNAAYHLPSFYDYEKPEIFEEKEVLKDKKRNVEEEEREEGEEEEEKGLTNLIKSSKKFKKWICKRRDDDEICKARCFNISFDNISTKYDMAGFKDIHHRISSFQEKNVNYNE